MRNRNVVNRKSSMVVQTIPSLGNKNMVIIIIAASASRRSHPVIPGASCVSACSPGFACPMLPVRLAPNNKPSPISPVIADNTYGQKAGESTILLTLDGDDTPLGMPMKIKKIDSTQAAMPS